MKSFVILLLVTLSLTQSVNRDNLDMCHLLLKSYLGSPDNRIDEVLSKTRHPKEATENKIKANLLVSCHDNLTEEKEQVIRASPIDYSALEELLEFQDNIFYILGPDVKFTKREEELLAEVVNHSGLSKLFPEEVLVNFRPKEKTWTDKLTIKNAITFVLVVLLIKSFFTKEEKKEEAESVKKKE